MSGCGSVRIVQEGITSGGLPISLVRRGSSGEERGAKGRLNRGEGRWGE